MGKAQITFNFHDTFWSLTVFILVNKDLAFPVILRLDFLQKKKTRNDVIERKYGQWKEGKYCFY